MPNSRLNGTALLKRRTYRNSPWRNTQWSEVLHNLYALDIHEKREIGETTRIGSKPNPKEGESMGERKERRASKWQIRGTRQTRRASSLREPEPEK